ncbi:MAG: GNAT family N-acetyltransferase, partial [Phycisphaerae bacterium]
MCHLTPAYLRWLYADNPRGQVIGFNAWSGGELAGHYAVIPIRALLDGKTVHAALSLNTAVHPDHQGKGLFTRLAEMTYDRAVALGVDHVVGVANANSTPGFVRKLAFESVGRLEARLFWRWPRPAVAGSVAAGRWSRRWDADDLSWRIRNPSARYTVRYHRGTRWILG